MKRHRPSRILTRADLREEAAIVRAHAQRMYDAIYVCGQTVVHEDEVIPIHQLRRDAIDVQELLRAA